MEALEGWEAMGGLKMSSLDKRYGKICQKVIHIC